MFSGGLGMSIGLLRDQSSITKSCRADALLIVIAAIQDWDWIELDWDWDWIGLNFERIPPLGSWTYMMLPKCVVLFFLFLTQMT